MTTGTQDFFIKNVIDETDYVTLYNYKSGKPVKVPSGDVDKKLKIQKQQLNMQDGQVDGIAESYKLYVRTKDECIDSVVSDVVSEVAPASNIKTNKRKRGRRGKRNH